MWPTQSLKYLLSGSLLIVNILLTRDQEYMEKAERSNFDFWTCTKGLESGDSFYPTVRTKVSPSLPPLPIHPFLIVSAYNLERFVLIKIRH